MKHLILYSILTFVSYVKLDKKDYHFFPNLPAGEFKVYFREIHNCDPSPDNKIQVNYHFSKISGNDVTVKGNVTSIIPFNDTFSYNMTWAVKDSIGAWKPNALLWRGVKACSALRNLINNADSDFKNFVCPLLPGVYVTPGFDLRKLSGPKKQIKTFFYGSYRFRTVVVDTNNKAHGCVLLVYDVLRPWETPN